ncbi:MULTISPECIES: DUF3800 domain-containing protein [unclassified Adlercreutzia]|uniref:DUF3800 domain-containing protein n=1 Tax=unclassified Adlercreutzia TaxID=2636013 RepID=UPI0013EA1F4B|nr:MULTISPECIES: DUF3800 domain-containing protein [unclassified Adlercreutzia]
MRELSVFVDESGDFGAVSHHCTHYLVGIILHDQSHPIYNEARKLSRALADAGLDALAPIHTAPLIRREERYANLDGSTRKKAFDALFAFARRCDIRHKVIVVDKRWFGCGHELEVRIARELGSFVRENLSYFQGFDRVIVYYDKGQKEVSRVLRLAFAASLSEVEFRVVSPADYLLFQAADLACTMELVEAKRQEGGLSRSERAFFGGAERFKKTYLKAFRRQDF